MSQRFQMIPVEPSAIESGQSRPDAVLTADGAWLASCGARLREPDKLHPETLQ